MTLSANAPQAYRGQAIGLPRTGPGSLTTSGPRLGAFVVDAVASTLIAALFVPHHGHTGNAIADRLPGTWSLIPLAVDYIVGSLVAGRTVGMYLFGLRLVRVGPKVAVDPGRIVVRTVLLFLLVPALVFDRDGRGLHDRVSDTAVVRA
ncbi:RDD family protein [uncultured Jatrophihabitans sp.]|uniref:RDD family protein n=1 Tax=uncultured Jatrophihabitans sp. TaxID=1610747 RepID=UPI0035CBECC9